MRRGLDVVKRIIRTSGRRLVLSEARNLTITVSSLLGSDAATRRRIASRLGEPSEEEGLLLYYHAAGGNGFTLLDEFAYPGRIQDVLRIVSISDSAYYFLPKDGKLSWMDGELALLLDFLEVSQGRVVTTGDLGVARSLAKKVFKGLTLEAFQVRSSDDPSLFSAAGDGRSKSKMAGDLTYVAVDRAFNVKGVGLIVLGFVIAGSVNSHDVLKILPQGKEVEVRSIQIMDVDVDSATEGSRVGLCLKGASEEDFQKGVGVGSEGVRVSHQFALDFRASPYFRQGIRKPVDLHIQTVSGLNLGHVAPQPDGRITVTFQKQVPVWAGQRAVLVDLNIRPGASRVIGGGVVSPFSLDRGSILL
jgi:selenocysteine-specific translation elongation factor